MEKLRKIVEESNTPAGRAFDLAIQALIVVSLVSFSIETLPTVSAFTKRVLWKIELVTVLVFSGEYLLRLVVSRKKLKFVFSFFGLVDLLAILPFYMASGIDLRAIRVFRIMRLARVLKMVRLNKALHRFGKAFSTIRSELIIFFTATMFLLYVSAIGIYYFENPAQPENFASVFHALWWSVVTLTTVGYGDVYPITVGGRVFTFFILMIGLGVVAVPAGLIASAMSATINPGSDLSEDSEN